jgi:ankyrin repeat protein
MDDLFDSSKAHFAAWVRVHDIDEDWFTFSPNSRDSVGSPLYYAAFCGFYDLAERLITKNPDQVNARGGRMIAPILAALYKRHPRVATLLHRYGAVVDVHGRWEYTPLHVLHLSGDVDIARWLLDHGADVNSRNDVLWTPLYVAASFSLHLGSIQVLLEYNADTNLQDNTGATPLYGILAHSHNSPDGEVVPIVRRLLEHGADPNIYNNKHKTPLHLASFYGLLEVARLLLTYGAKIDEKDEEGKTPFQLAASEGHDEMTKLLIEHGAVPQP